MMSATAAKTGWMGTFSPVTFSNLLKQVAAESQSGAFQIVSGNRIKTVHVDKGAISFATSNVRNDRLGESMLAHDSISTTDYKVASQRMRDDGCRFGEALLKMGRLDRKKLHRELGVQVQRIVLSLFGMADGLYSFDANTSSGVHLPFSLSVPPLLLKGLRRVQDGRDILDALPHANAVVCMTREPTYKFDLARLARIERDVLSRARKGASIGDLVRRGDIDRSAALRSCYALLTVGLLELVPLQQKKEAIDEADARELIDAQFVRLEQVGGEDLLGVRKDVSIPTLREAYDSLRAEWAELRTQVTVDELLGKIDTITLRLATVFKELVEKRNRAGDDATRQRLIRQLETEARKRLQEKDWNGAVTVFEELIALAPEDATFRLMLGRVMQHHPRLRDKAEEHLLFAIELSPKDPNFPLELARYYQRRGKSASAVAAVDRVLELDPGNKEAPRILLAQSGVSSV